MTEKNRHIAFICSKGNLDMAYPALIMGWAALGDGIDVTFFFTFWGLDLVNKHRVDRLEIPPIANSSMKMNMMGVPGYIGIPQFMGGLPGMTPFATALMKKKMDALGVPPVREYLEMLSDAGARMYGCKMTVDMFDLTEEDFLPCIERVVTASDFMDMTADAQIVFI